MCFQAAIKAHPVRFFWVGVVIGVLIGVLLGYQSFKQLAENVQDAVLKSGRTTINSFESPQNGN